MIFGSNPYGSIEYSGVRGIVNKLRAAVQRIYRAFTRPTPTTVQTGIRTQIIRINIRTQIIRINN